MREIKKNPEKFCKKGRPKNITQLQEEQVINARKADPFKPASEIQKIINPPISVSSVKAILLKTFQKQI